MSEGLSPPKKQKLKRQCHFDRKWVEEFQGIGRSSKGWRTAIVILNFCIDIIKNYVIAGVLFGCGQGVVFVPEIDSGKLAPICCTMRVVKPIVCGECGRIWNHCCHALATTKRQKSWFYWKVYSLRNGEMYSVLFRERLERGVSNLEDYIFRRRCGAVLRNALEL